MTPVLTLVRPRAAVSPISPHPTPYRVICSSCDHDRQVTYYLTLAEFTRQSRDLYGAWTCPACGSPADFDHAHFEDHIA